MTGRIYATHATCRHHVSETVLQEGLCLTEDAQGVAGC